MKHTQYILAAVTGLLFTATSPASADANPQTGNYAITFLDVPQTKDGHELAIRRTYNSHSSAKGWLGYGWGTPYETKLVAMPDLSIIVQDNGSGHSTAYMSHRHELQEGVEKIVAAEKGRKNLKPQAAAELARSLLGNDQARYRLVQELEMKVEIPEGVVHKTEVCPEGSVVRTIAGYNRVRCDGGRETFDAQGRLQSVTENDGYGFELVYKDGRPDRAIDTAGQSLIFSWVGGHLTSATMANGKSARYEQVNGDLVNSQNENGTQLAYTYDSYKNLLKILWVQDTSTYEYTYADPAWGKIGTVKDRRGVVKTYEYRTDPEDPLHTWTKVTTVPYDKDIKPSSSEYEYQQAIDGNGTQKVTAFAISTPESSSGSAYDAQGRLVLKRTDLGTIEIVYHPKTDKIIMLFSPGLATEVRYDVANVVEQIVVRPTKGAPISVKFDARGKMAGAPSFPNNPESGEFVRRALIELASIAKM